MKKLEEVSKKVDELSSKVENQVKEKVMPKIKGYEFMIMAVLVVMLLAGLVSGRGLMIVAGILVAVVIGLPKYSTKLMAMIPKKEEKKEAKKTTSKKGKKDEPTAEVVDEEKGDK